jgi:flagellar basal body rod protein FlgC
MLAITSDNASNMDTMLSYIEKSYMDAEINFNKENQHIRCLAHIINLAAQNALKHLKIEEMEEDTSITRKVNRKIMII